MSLKDKYAIAGVGLTKVGKIPGVSTMSFTLEAMKIAIEDAGLTRDDVDGALLLSPVRMGEQHGWGARVAALMEISTTFTNTMDIGGATPIAMIQTAAMAIEAGMCNVVVCAFGNQNNPQGVHMTLPNLEFTMPYGDIGAIPFQAHIARHHMHEYGLTSRQLGEIAVTFRNHACLNPDAQMRPKGPFTIEDHQSSRMVIEPLHLLDVCVNTDGGGAVVVTSAERAKDLKHPPVYIMGMGQSHSSEVMPPWPGKTEHRGGTKAAEMAFEMAGVTHNDIDVAQLYDGFTILVINELENFGFCKLGEGGSFVEEGRLRLDGALPSNTAGGLLSEGHLMGMGHVVEAVRQLRGQCGERQVKDAEICFVNGYGGAPHEYPPTLSYSTLILRR